MKKIENANTRDAGDTNTVAYLSDISAVTSDFTALCQVVGGLNYEPEYPVTFNTLYVSGSDDIIGTIRALDSKLMSDVGDSYGQSNNIIYSDFSIKENLHRLDNDIGGYYGGIHFEYSDPIKTALAKIDSAIGSAEGRSGKYIYEGPNVWYALFQLDSALSGIDELMGTYYDCYSHTLNFTNADTNFLYHGSQTVSDALIRLDSATAVTVTRLSIPTSGYATTYSISQNGSSVGTIDIPKDFLVKSATLETVTTADTPYAGAKVGDKYIDFVINTVDETEAAQHIYLPVNDLVDVYTAAPGATQVQIAIDSNNVISAALVDGGVLTAKLADSAVTTAKIADGAVATAKIVDSAVTTAKIADSSVATAKIADGAVTTDKIRLIDTQVNDVAYTLQVANGRLQVVQIA